MNRREARADAGVNITCDDPELPADLQRLTALVESMRVRFGRTSAEVNIAVVDDAAIRKINEQFLGHTHATDVISFDLSEEGATAFELVVNADEAARQSRRRDHSVEAELALYITHGLLHQLGYDDAEPEDAARMHAAEDAILEEAGYGPVYGRPACGGENSDQGEP